LYTLYSYSAVQIIAGGIAKAGSAEDAQKVADIVTADGRGPTVIGDNSFDAKGDVTRPDYIISEWKKGEDGKPTYAEN
jgi:branched-chain amino acid transport system substrate-binding protein